MFHWKNLTLPAAASSSNPAYVSSRPVSDSESPYRESLSVEQDPVRDSSEAFDFEPNMIVDTDTGFDPVLQKSLQSIQLFCENGT